MSGFLTIVLWTVFGAGLLVTLGICLPWCVALKVRFGAGGGVTLVARPWGWHGPALLRVDSTPAPAPLRVRDDGQGSASHRRDARHAGNGRSVAWARRAASEAPKLLHGLLDCVRLDFLTLQARIGMDDPADTGRLFGLLMPVAHLPLEPRLSVDLTPDFDREVVDGWAEAGVRILPARVILPMLRFGWAMMGPRSWA